MNKVTLCELGDLVPYAKDPERVLPTHVSSNRLTELNTSCGTCSSLWTSSSPSWQWSGAPGEHWLGQSPTEGQESFCGSPGFQRRSSSTLLEKKMNLEKLEWVKEQFNAACITSPLRLHSVELSETCLAWDYFPWRKERSGEWTPGFSNCMGHCQGLISAPGIQSPKLEAPWIKGGRRLGK